MLLTPIALSVTKTCTERVIVDYSLPAYFTGLFCWVLKTTEYHYYIGASLHCYSICNEKKLLFNTGNKKTAGLESDCSVITLPIGRLSLIG